MKTKAGLRIVTLFIAVIIGLYSSVAFATNTIYIAGQNDNELTFGTDRNRVAHIVGWIDGSFNNDSNISKFVCIDYGAPLLIPYRGEAAKSYDVNVSTFSSLTGVKSRDAFGDPLVSQYKEAAWLMFQMEANPADTSAIQFAMWRIFNSNTPYTRESVKWFNDATDGRHSLTDEQLSWVRIFTPKDGTSQEVMSFVPLPAGLWLFGSGIAALVAMRRRKTLRFKEGE